MGCTQSFIASKSTFLAETEDTVQDEGFDISYAQIKTKKNIILKPLWAPLVEVCGYKPDTKSISLEHGTQLLKS